MFHLTYRIRIHHMAHPIHIHRCSSFLCMFCTVSVPFQLLTYYSSLCNQSAQYAAASSSYDTSLGCRQRSNAELPCSSSPSLCCFFMLFISLCCSVNYVVIVYKAYGVYGMGAHQYTCSLSASNNIKAYFGSVRSGSFTSGPHVPAILVRSVSS